MSRSSSKSEAVGGDLRASEHRVRLLRRRRSPDAPWEWRASCTLCGGLGGWANGEQAATELGFEHARYYTEPEQLVLELELPNGRITRRRS